MDGRIQGEAAVEAQKKPPRRRAAWPDLPPHIKAAVWALVATGR
jgi:hypothetical protein